MRKLFNSDNPEPLLVTVGDVEGRAAIEVQLALLSELRRPSVVSDRVIIDPEFARRIAADEFSPELLLPVFKNARRIEVQTDKEQDEYKAVIGKPTGGNISRKGVAKFILDSLESEKYVKDVVTLFR